MGLAVNLYSRNGCGPCRAVKRFLENNSIPFTETNTSLLGETEADEVRATLAEDGYKGAPVTYVYGAEKPFSFHGFDPDKLVEVAALFPKEGDDAAS